MFLKAFNILELEGALKGRSVYREVNLCKQTMINESCTNL